MEIEVKNLTKYFGDNKVLDDLNFNIDKGEIVGFLGPNAAGKTTTMRILTGFLAPKTGQITIAGQNILENYLEIRKKIGYLPENNPLYNELRVYEYLEFIAAVKNIENNKQEIKRVVEICGLKEKVTQLISELSKGFRQRVGLAQALLGNPEIIIMDEPTSGLDPKQIIEIRNLIKEIGKTKTIILSTHILNEVEATCNRLIIINKGKIVASGTTQELISQAKGKAQIKIVILGPKPEIETALSQLPEIEKITSEPSDKIEENIFILETKENTDPRRRIFELCISRNWIMLGLEYKVMKLEDVFLELTKTD